MKTLLLNAESEEDVQVAARLLKEGKVVAFPTETVYGLGARADDEAAVERIYRLKGRPREKQLAILIPSVEAAEKHAAPLSRAARILAERFWPGPLSSVLWVR